jgi:hypothetical protein
VVKRKKISRTFKGVQKKKFRRQRYIENNKWTGKTTKRLAKAIYKEIDDKEMLANVSTV